MAAPKTSINTYVAQLKHLSEGLFGEIEEYALMHMVHNISKQLEIKIQDRSLPVDNRVLLTSGNAVYDYHAQFPLKASFLHLTWFELMVIDKASVEADCFKQFFKIVDEVESNGTFRNDHYDRFFDYARDSIFEEGDSIMEQVINELKDILSENGVTSGEVDVNQYSFRLTW